MLKISNPDLLTNLPQENRFIGSLPSMENSSININGSNNILYCDNNVHLLNSSLTFNGNNSVIFLSENKHDYKLNVTIYNNSAFYIGRNNYFNGILYAILSEQKHIFIGNDGVFSFGIWMRIADPHLIYDSKTKNRLNPSQSIYIGDHIWLGQSSMILKGSHIHSGSIIGAMSVVSGKTLYSNCSYVGNPVRKIRNNIIWTNQCVHSWTDSETKQHKSCQDDSFLFHYDKNNYRSFDEIDKVLTQADDSTERYKFLQEINCNKNKNRFALNEKECHYNISPKHNNIFCFLKNKSNRKR